MASIKLPLTTRRLKKSLSEDNLRRFGVHLKMLEDKIDQDGTIIIKWHYSDFIFLSMTITATKTCAVEGVDDTTVFDLDEVVNITVSGNKGGSDASIAGLQVADIKTELGAMFEIWNNLHVRLHGIIHKGPYNTEQSKRCYIAVAP